MRISTDLFFQTALRGMQKGTAQLSKTQQMIATGTKILTPSDDPVANSKVIQVQQSLTLTQKYQDNIVVANGRNETAEGVLSHIDQVLQRVRELAIQSNSGALSGDNRGLIADELRQLASEMKDLMNNQDGLGSYLFGGYQTTAQPFAERAGGGYDYLGDEGGNLLQVASSTRVPVSDSGKKLFVDVRSASNSVATQAAPGNSTNPGASISAGTVLDQTRFDTVFPEDFVVTFNDPELNQNRMTYTITRRSDGKPVMGAQPPGYLVNVPYEAGGRIQFNGLEFFMTGKPQANDQFFIESTGNQSILNMVDRFARILETKSANALTLPTQVEVIGRASPGKSNVNTAGNYVAAQTITVKDPGGALQTVDINANESGADIATALNALTGVTATAEPAESTLNFSNTTVFEGETIRFRINNTQIIATGGATPAVTYANIDAALGAFFPTATLSYINNGNGAFTFTESAGNDISIEDFEVADIPRLDINVLGGFSAGDTISFTLSGSGGETVPVNYVVAAGTVDEFLTEVQNDIAAAGAGASFDLTQPGGAGTAIRLRYLGDTDGNANFQIADFTDSGGSNAQLTAVPTTGTTVTSQATQANVSVIGSGADYTIAAQEGRATVQYRGSIGDPVTLLEGAGDSSSVASRVSISLTDDYEISSSVESGNGGIIEQTPDIEEAATNLFSVAVNVFLKDIDNAQDSVIRARSDIGARLNTLQSVKDLNEGTIVELKTFMSELKDVDFAEAMTNLNFQLFVVEAAQSSFVRVSQLNLFSLLR